MDYSNDDQNDFDGYYNGIYDFYDPFYTGEEEQPPHTAASNGSCCCCSAFALSCFFLPAVLLIGWRVFTML